MACFSFFITLCNLLLLKGIIKGGLTKTLKIICWISIAFGILTKRSIILIFTILLFTVFSLIQKKIFFLI